MILGVVGALVALAGFLATGVGAAVSPASSTTRVPSTSARPSSPLPSMAAADEPAIVAAEASLADVRGSTTSTGNSDLAVLGDAAAAAAVDAADRRSALAALAAVEVKGRAPLTGYVRSLFGAGWVDTDHNGCDTRNDVLARDLAARTYKQGTRDCVVLTGTLADPYAARSINFQRGEISSRAVQIDHVVALADAWQKGAQGWDAGKREAFANDRLNLLAVDGPLNEQKGAGDAATWLPPNRAYRCAYVARQVAVKITYGLWMTQAEKNASATVHHSCPSEPLPAGVAANLPPRPVTPPASTPSPTPPAPLPVPAPLPAPAPAPAPLGGGDVYYPNCSAAKAAGAAPLRVGQPGYRPALDRDGDGVACER